MMGGEDTRRVAAQPQTGGFSGRERQAWDPLSECADGGGREEQQRPGWASGVTGSRGKGCGGAEEL